MLDSSNEPIHRTKREMYDKSIAYFKVIRSFADWKHVVNKNSPNLAYNEFLRIFFDLYNEAFPKQKIKVKSKSFNTSSGKKSRYKISSVKKSIFFAWLSENIN